jgi:hypothetical protein
MWPLIELCGNGAAKPNELGLNALLTLYCISFLTYQKKKNCISFGLFFSLFFISLSLVVRKLYIHQLLLMLFEMHELYTNSYYWQGFCFAFINSLQSC